LYVSQAKADRADREHLDEQINQCEPLSV